MHAGPSKYSTGHTAQASKPRKGRKGSVEKVAKKRRLGHPHERKGKSAPSGKGFGKIVGSGKPRFTRFSQF